MSTLGALLGPLLAAAVGIAISPVAVGAVILLLLSRRATAASIAFLLGWTVGIAGAVTIFALITVALPASARTAVGVVQVAVGVILVVLAAVTWRRGRGRSGDSTLMRLIDAARPAVVLPVGVLMAVNPPNLLLSLAGGVAVASADLAAAGLVAAIAVFTLVAASTVLIPVVAHLVVADRMRRPLGALRTWLLRAGWWLLPVVLLVVGVLSVWQGAVAIRG